jgi:hypothetical protein
MGVNDDAFFLEKCAALEFIVGTPPGASSLLQVIHSSFYRMTLDEVSPIGFDCFRYLSNRNLPAHVEAQHASASPQHSRLAH